MLAAAPLGLTPLAAPAATHAPRTTGTDPGIDCGTPHTTWRITAPTTVTVGAPTATTTVDPHPRR